MSCRRAGIRELSPLDRPKIRDIELIKRPVRAAMKIKLLQQRFDLAERAQDTLAKHRTIPRPTPCGGRYLCLLRNQWTEGLPHWLAATMSSFPNWPGKTWPRPQRPSSSGTGRRLVGSAEAEKSAVKKQYQSRAYYWYSKASSSATGCQVKVDKRLQ